MYEPNCRMSSQRTVPYVAERNVSETFCSDASARTAPKAQRSEEGDDRVRHTSPLTRACLKECKQDVRRALSRRVTTRLRVAL